MSEFLAAGPRALTPNPSPDPAGEGGRSFGRSLVFALLLSLVFAFSVTSARADGEAGLVVQNGDSTTTYCVPFKGDSITGADLLSAAGLGYEQFGGAARTVCSIGGTGCGNAASFESCFCQCQGSNCTYWAFFTQKHGEGWVYSSLAFNLLRAKDGDVQGWKWGRGSPNSAPAPNAVTFENICGHGPRGGEDLLPTPTRREPTQQPATASVTASAPSVSATDAAPGNTTTTVASETEAPGPSPSAAASSPVASASATAAIPAATDAIGTVTVTTALTHSPTALAPATGGPRAANGAGGSSGLLAFAAVAGGLVVVTAAAVVWRRRHGA